jgi:hypothetical protein
MKETTRKTKRRWVDNIELDLRETASDGMDWIWLRIGRSGGLL